jgi:hypothetical protein
MTNDFSTMKDADMPLLDRIEAALARVRSRQGLMRIPVEATDMDVVVSDCREEIKRLRDDLAALKAQADPLHAMWAALAEYQRFANRDGHGESWRIMCEERTRDQAADAANPFVNSSAAARAAARAAAGAAAHFEEAMKSAADAVAAIRRAKEAKP